MLTAGRLDTNSLYLTGELNNLGVEVVTKCVIGDDRDRLADAVARALGRSAIVILSGGLGPTEDDVTREAVAQALGRQLVFHADIAEALERRFAAMKRKMSEINKRQAFVIEGAEVLPNDRGTAPGQWVAANGAVAMLLPGPPHELKAMFEQQCLPRLARLAPKQAIRTAFLRVTGMPESDLDALISPVYKKYQNPVTTILAANGDLQVHLRARCDTEAEADALLAEVTGPIEALLGDRLYSRDRRAARSSGGRPAAPAPRHPRGSRKLHRRHVRRAIDRRRPAVRDYFVGGFITYSNALKHALLDVPAETLEQFGAVSQETAAAMAEGARRRTGSTYAISITGVAGPDGGTEQKPVGVVYMGVADPAGAVVSPPPIPGRPPAHPRLHHAVRAGCAAEKAARARLGWAGRFPSQQLGVTNEAKEEQNQSVSHIADRNYCIAICNGCQEKRHKKNRPREIAKNRKLSDLGRQMLAPLACRGPRPACKGAIHGATGCYGGGDKLKHVLHPGCGTCLVSKMARKLSIPRVRASLPFSSSWVARQGHVSFSLSSRMRSMPLRSSRWRSLGVWRLAFGVWRLAFGVWRLA